MRTTASYEKTAKPHLEEIKEAVEKGATCAEIAKGLGIAEGTLYRWQNEHSELKEAFACGRREIVVEIKNALLKRALGYEFIEERTCGKRDENGKSVELVETYKKHLPPSETACAMLLRNYDKSWRDKDETETEVKKKQAELMKLEADLKEKENALYNGTERIVIKMDVKDE